ncbi:hypothetical protein EJ02DRAFT_249487 [Clathrospora elynae]|uniref:Uncharacterized protein n=1 Tax=Clathrospora elynae TaxID=706981 RepID=A0A6A5T2Q7_9PLEO|nr:hypothetical protein EJ02DRAFT_249487 [Clathrospora elynae]
MSENANTHTHIARYTYCFVMTDTDPRHYQLTLYGSTCTEPACSPKTPQSHGHTTRNIL